MGDKAPDTYQHACNAFLHVQNLPHYTFHVMVFGRFVQLVDCYSRQINRMAGLSAPHVYNYYVDVAARDVLSVAPRFPCAGSVEAGSPKKFSGGKVSRSDNPLQTPIQSQVADAGESDGFRRKNPYHLIQHK